MKTITTIILLLFSIFIYAQRNVTTLHESKIGNVHLEYKQKISKSDTIEYVRISFQNKEYSLQEDIKSAEFGNNESISRFKNNLEWGIQNVNTIDDSRGIVYVYKIRNKIYLFLRNGIGSNASDGYTTLSTKQAQQIIDWLEQIEIPKNYIPEYLK